MRRIPTRERRIVSALIGCLMMLLTVGGIWVSGGPTTVTAESTNLVTVPSQTPMTTTVQSTRSPTRPAPAPTMAGMEERRRVLLQPLPPSATQADRGAQIYNLVCSACHAYSGEGLTDAWRSTWAPEDQNCWQAKCHAPNHPPDGFEIPRYVPPAVGPAVTARFRTALDLYEYVRTTMPWHEPGSLLDEQYWDITAYLLRLMAADQGSMTLDGQNAARVELPRPQGEPKTATPSPTATLAATVDAPPHAPTKPPKAALAEAPARAGLLLPVWLLVLGLAVVCVVGAVFLVVARSRRHR